MRKSTHSKKRGKESVLKIDLNGYLIALLLGWKSRYFRL